MKYASSIFELIDALYLPSKVFGMAPYTRDVVNHKRAFRFKKNNYLYIGYILVIIVFMLVTVLARLALEDKAPSFHDAIIGTLFVLSQATNMAKLLELFVQTKVFLKTLDLINHADELLKDVGLQASYKSFHITLLLLYLTFPFYLFFLVAPIWEIVGSVQATGFFSRETQKHIMLMCNVAILFGVRFTSVYLYNAFIFISIQRLQQMNRCIREVEITATFHRETSDRLLSTAAQMHYTVHKLTYNFNKCFGWATFGSITMAFVEIVVSVMSSGLAYFGSWKVHLTTALFNVTALITLPLGQKIKTESHTMGRLLCDLTLPYFDEVLRKKRCTLLYQMLHEPLDLSAAGFYALDVKAILAHLELTCSLLMFLLNIQQVIK
ncbi:hypothetical protein PPYR_09316 [Photinus pyralis]|uniref:Gustatory receptor n=1 Tax=Photinus pyralis TaxID=7054 RepID=A0A5N4AM38_PHOPY|nr:uncharacterized protein LOC116171212 [Photinus pyralis]KAB0798323.1 hypothetical protein PPYR_09316 [Photinus pyralis]